MRRTAKRRSVEESSGGRVVSLSAVSQSERLRDERTLSVPTVRIGELVRIDDDGHVWVELGEVGRPDYALKSITTASLSARDLGARVAVWDGRDGVGVVLGKQVTPEKAAQVHADAQVDGRRVVIEAADEIVLRCGRSSLTLRRNGRVVLRGAYIETSAEGVHRIKGGSVQIN